MVGSEYMIFIFNKKTQIFIFSQTIDSLFYKIISNPNESVQPRSCGNLTAWKHSQLQQHICPTLVNLLETLAYHMDICKLNRILVRQK